MKLFLFVCVALWAFVVLLFLLGGDLAMLLVFGLATVVFAGAYGGNARAVARARLVAGVLLVLILTIIASQLAGC